ncbi:hypothetical protein Bca52824_094391 [Brassica carinata]|uniref:Uncharacterized protein n=1 Tax=Brassica carinata TaxID=52824 RepID=A0A8X7TKT1_BRACI|nr:hypothetical protein Bca52824_094391 [Brassica carinata]
MSNCRCLYNDENDKQWHYLLVLGETCEAAFQLDSQWVYEQGYEMWCSEGKGRLCGEELAVTVLVTGNAEKLSRLGDEKVVDFLDVWLHIGGYSLGVGEKAASLALVGHGRDVANAKYSDWVRYCALLAYCTDSDSLVSGIKLAGCGLGRLRKPLEKFRPSSTTELLCRTMKSSSGSLYGESLGEYEVQTAPVTDGVLPGVIREIVIEVCISKGIPYRERAPSWSERELWEEAFITSSLRILQHVGTIKVPVGSLEALACTKPEEIEWKEKRFEEGPGMITELIQKAIMERGIEEGFPLEGLV